MEVEFAWDLIVNKIDFEVKIQIYEQRSLAYVYRGIISFFHDFVSLFLCRFLSNKGQIFPPKSYKWKDLRPFYYLVVVKSTMTINSSHAQLFEAYFQIPVSTRRERIISKICFTYHPARREKQSPNFVSTI